MEFGRHIHEVRKRQKTGEIKVEPSSIEPAAVAQNIHVSDTTIKTEPLDEITGLSSEQAKLFARKAVIALSNPKYVFHMVEKMLFIVNYLLKKCCLLLNYLLEKNVAYC